MQNGKFSNFAVHILNRFLRLKEYTLVSSVEYLDHGEIGEYGPEADFWTLFVLVLQNKEPRIFEFQAWHRYSIGEELHPYIFDDFSVDKTLQELLLENQDVLQDENAHRMNQIMALCGLPGFIITENSPIKKPRAGLCAIESNLMNLITRFVFEFLQPVVDF